ncbi:hypothetical protein H4R19_000014 [Coemansia spiralis]|nr:hypothetical protein H4R19_000014 [Coemansia spiralis]
MVSFSAYAAAALAFAGAARAGFYTTYPIGADQISSLQPIQIKWQPSADAPSLVGVTQYTLRLMTGGNLVQTTVATIGTFPVSQTTVSFTIPQTAPGMYFLMYSIDGATGGSSWSTRFSVDKGTTWYPAGVATGRDPGDIETGATSAAPSSAPVKTSAVVSVTATNGKGNESSAMSASGDNETTSSAADDTTAPHSDSAEDSGSAKDTESTDDVNTQTTSELGSEGTDASEHSESSSHSKSSKHSSSSDDESSSERETESSGAATYFLSMAAVLAASLLVI